MEIEEYRELDEIKFELHDLLKKLAIKTGLGYISDDYTETIEFDLGDINIISDNYYHDLKIITDEGEIDLNHNLEIAEKILEEVQKRSEEYEKKTAGKRKNDAEEIFEKDFKIEK